MLEWPTLLVTAAGVLAGIVGTAGGITSMVSYPALLAAGLSPFQANLANLVGIVATWPASALASRRELDGLGRTIAPMLLASACGATSGTVLLLTTPTDVFDRIVPWLVLLGSGVLLAQPGISRWRARRGAPSSAHPGVAAGWVALISVYGGYFGAGSGVMLLTTSLILIDPRLPRANAVKNMLVGAACVTAAVLIVITTDVPWAETLSLGAGLFVGGLIGPRIARTLPPRLIRWAVAILGVVLAAQLALQAW